jgi:hypothetical protein
MKRLLVPQLFVTGLVLETLLNVALYVVLTLLTQEKTGLAHLDSARSLLTLDQVLFEVVIVVSEYSFFILTP